MRTIGETTIEICPFHVDISDEALEVLRRRIAAVRLPSRELVDDRSQGVQLATIQELTRYWVTDYDWRKCEAKLNALPQFKTRAALDAVTTFRTSGFGYFLEQATRPQTIGYALLDSPVALAAWILDHDTDSYYKISRAFVDRQPAGHLTRDRIVDNITLYWLTGTAVSAARSYWESGRAASLAAGQAPPPASLPVGFTTFPGEVFRAPRSLVEKSYPNLTYFNKVDKGGHFAAWEEPALFSEEIRAAFRPLREQGATN
jgi:pimeloyl-ACP methyl ester carboxylesterase